jgi:hypothetical protein
MPGKVVGRVIFSDAALPNWSLVADGHLLASTFATDCLTQGVARGRHMLMMHSGRLNFDYQRGITNGGEDW